MIVVYLDKFFFVLSYFANIKKILWLKLNNEKVLTKCMGIDICKCLEHMQFANLRDAFVVMTCDYGIEK